MSRKFVNILTFEDYTGQFSFDLGAHIWILPVRSTFSFATILVDAWLLPVSQLPKDAIILPF